jgi:hypothetical protein
MEIRQVGAELSHEDRRKDRRTDIHNEVNVSLAILWTRLKIRAPYEGKKL